jgi:hypothetical protein
MHSHVAYCCFGVITAGNSRQRMKAAAFLDTVALRDGVGSATDAATGIHPDARVTANLGTRQLRKLQLLLEDFVL